MRRLPAPATTTGQLSVQVNMPDGSTITESTSGTVATVDRTNSPFGAGWGLSGLDQLVPFDGGVVWVTGTGQTRVFTGSGPGTFTGPADDFGTLVENADGSFTYTAKGQRSKTSTPRATKPAWWTPTACNGPSATTATTASPRSGHRRQHQHLQLRPGPNGQLTSIVEPGDASQRTLSFTEDGRTAT